MRLKFISIFSFLIVLTFSFSVFGQISHGGSPYFKSIANRMRFETVLMSVENIRHSKSERFEGKSRLKHAKFAYELTLDKSIDNSGKWLTIPNGQRVWNLAVNSPGAYSLSLVFDKFRLPKGGQLFVYNYTDDRVLGAYTEKNNKAFGRFAIEPLAGEDLIIEYIEPLNPEFKAELRLGKVYHDFKNVFRVLGAKRSHVKSLSGSCNVNINCSEGLNWQLEKQAVCQIIYNGFVASGTLMNNTKKDGKPYILTAHHAISEEGIAEEAIFYFNYEAESCEGTSGTKSQSISGSNLRATTEHLDFSLLEMSSIPPSIYQPYYAGWDRSGKVPNQTVCIHHPSGDVKKISIDGDAPLTGSYSDSDYTFDNNTHWHIETWELGTTEGGSSGSPLFDMNHRVIGDLTGGDANCSSSVNDYFAKFSSSWDTYPDKENQLKYWLDTENTGVVFLDAYNSSVQFDKRIVCVESDVEVFFDFKMDYDSYFWDFGLDAIPSTSTNKEPHTVKYATSGVKMVRLTYTKNGVSENEFASLLVVDETEPNFTYLYKQKSFEFREASLNAMTYHWNFGDGETSESMNPNHVYKNSGKYQVSLTTGNTCGENSLTQIVNTSYDSELKVYPNPSKHAKTRVDLNAILFNRIDWWLYDTRGAQCLSGFVSQYNSFFDLDLRLFSAGLYILKMDIDGSIVERKIVVEK